MFGVNMQSAALDGEIKPIIPNQGIVLQEEKPFFVLCKPKLLPLKSMTLEKLEKMQRDAHDKAKKQMDEEKEKMLDRLQ
ncbi:BBSome-interacting protein 1 [Halotydeus destructor]|nr:BBSome-interacting protein 1 [Halotydeus destructor]